MEVEEKMARFRSRLDDLDVDIEMIGIGCLTITRLYTWKRCSVHHTL